MASFRSTIAQRRLDAALRTVAIGGLAAMLGGCYSVKQDFATYPQDYRERHPITLRDGGRTVEVFLGRSRGGLSPAQRADVLAFAQTWKHEATSGIIIDVPNGGDVKLAAADSMREIHSILNASGVPGNGVRVRSYVPADLTLQSIKISYAKLTAEVGPCGRWPVDIGPTADSAQFENRPYWNLGCATQRNLASMADNPADLVQPRGEAPVYQARRSVVGDKYRKGENPSGTYAGYDTGKISGLGK
jgi:pilus assembly protein CpaD